MAPNPAVHPRSGRSHALRPSAACSRDRFALWSPVDGPYRSRRPELRWCSRPAPQATRARHCSTRGHSRFTSPARPAPTTERRLLCSPSPPPVHAPPERRRRRQPEERFRSNLPCHLWPGGHPRSRPPGGTPITRSCHAHGWPLRSAHGHAQDRPLSSQGLARTDGVRALPFPPPRAALRLAPRVLPRIHGKPSPAPGRTRTLRGRSLSATPSRSPWPGALRRAGGTTSAPGRRSRAAASRGRTSRLSAPPIPGSTWSPPRVGDEGA